MTDEDRVRLREALKTVAVTLKQGDVPFALTGGYALWARGGPEPDHDVDFVVAAQDADRVAASLAEHGLDVQRPPEDWLFKVYVDGAMVDVLFRLSAEPVDRSLFDDVDEVGEIEVESVRMPVLSATRLMIDKLNALEEHDCDLGAVLPVARAVREQVAWAEVERRTDGNPFAGAALFLFRELGLVG